MVRGLKLIHFEQFMKRNFARGNDVMVKSVAHVVKRPKFDPSFIQIIFLSDLMW